MLFVVCSVFMDFYKGTRLAWLDEFVLPGWLSWARASCSTNAFRVASGHRGRYWSIQLWGSTACGGSSLSPLAAELELSPVL